jgi:EmrB/QacA subfamily drug resistance transporter
MSTASHEPLSPARGVAAPDPRRWRALGVLALVQFMLVLDITVVTVALPRIQHDLSFSRPGLAWVVNGYVLMAGGFLLLGGRLADLFGRRRLFLIGVLVFGAASAACGAAVSSSMLVASRFVQGTGEALAGPAALGMIPVLFPDSRERMKALGVWGGIAGLGGTLGSVISGALTDLASWRWIFYINLPVVLFALVMVPRVLSESRMAREGRRMDVPGAVTATGGLVAIVDGLLQAASHPWGSWPVLLPLLGGVALLLVMVAVEARAPEPLIPVRFFTNRTRVTSNVLSLALLAAFIGYVFLLTLYQQQVLGYSPLRTGLQFVPLGVGIGAGIGLGTAAMPRVGVKPVLTIGLFGSAAGLLLASYIQPGSSYAGGILPGLTVFGVFSGICFPALINGALHQVTGQDSGLASGVQTAMQQVGSALGLATLVTIALRYADAQISRGVPPAVAQTQGYVLSFRVGAAVLAAAALLALILLEHVSATLRTPVAEIPADQEPAVPRPLTPYQVRTSRSARGPDPAVDRDDGTGHVAAAAAAEEHGHAGHVFRAADPPERRGGGDLLALLGQGDGHHLGLERARGHGVDGDVPRPELAGQDPGELVQPGLAGRVRVGAELRHAQRVDAAHVDHPGRVIGRPGRLQQRQERPGQEERRLKIQVHDLVPGRGGKLGQRRAPVGAGVVDQDVNPLLEPADLGGQPDALLLAGQVGRYRQDHAVLGQLGDGGLPGLGLARADVDRSPRLQQPPRHHQPDPAAPAADDGDLAGEVEQVHELLHPKSRQSRSP